jgi:aminobenzoyl-glutamate utilization protein B
VITDGGDQPNVVPSVATVWYYFREQTFDRIRTNFGIGNDMADGAAKMSGTTVSRRIVGSAAPQHFNKPMAEAAYANIKAVGLPQWSADDQTLAKAVQHELKVPEKGLETAIAPIRGGGTEESFTGGPSDDIGDVSWNVPTIVLAYPANIPNLPGHNWANAISMATPIAHKGTVAGAEAQAMTLLDLLTRPELVTAAWDYFRNVQTRDQKYVPFIRPTDHPHVELNKAIMDKYTPDLQKFYYDSAKYPTYLDQLGIHYPTVRPAQATAVPAADVPSLDLPTTIGNAMATQ